MQTLLKKLAAVSVFILAGINGQAIGMEKNLAGVPEEQKRHLQQLIVALADAQHDAYGLSVPLIASAQHGDEATYHAVLKKMNAALDKEVTDDAFKAWMLGRIVYAADSIHDLNTVQAVQGELLGLLTEGKLDKLDPASLGYTMYAWACGYYAGVGKTNYEQIRQPMLASLSALEIAARSDPSNHELASNALWAAVLTVHAAASVDDREVYDDTINRLKAIPGSDTVSAALDATLTRTEQSSDYPAWAIGMLRVSAATVGDLALTEELNQPLHDAIRQAKKWGGQPDQSQSNQWKASSEAVLGELSELLGSAKASS